VSKHDSGTISASRSARECNEGERYTADENKKRNIQLESRLMALGYGVTSIRGTYIEGYGSDNEKEVKEQSFIVVDMKDKGTLKEDLIKLGTMFEQDSITFSKPDGDYYLISTNRCPNGYPGNGQIGKEVKLGKPMFGKKGMFHSKIKGRPFVFEQVVSSNVIMLTDDYPTHIRSILEFAKQDIVK